LSYKKWILIIFGLSSFIIGNGQAFYSIPRQVFNPYEVIGYNKNDNEYTRIERVKNFRMEIDSFEISSQVMFAAYKEYLDAIKKDSSYNFYLSQLPDSGITSKENYIKYIADKKYDDFPVLGISWEAAMNYCKWKTLTENDRKKLGYIYCLPQVSEWLAAYSYLEKNKIKNDFNRNFSDWTMNLYYEGSYFGYDSNFKFDLVYLPKQKDKPRDKRMRVIGDSYLFQGEDLIQFRGFYAFEGYRQVSFRMVKVYVNEKAFTKNVIKYWGLSN